MAISAWIGLFWELHWDPGQLTFAIGEFTSMPSDGVVQKQRPELVHERDDNLRREPRLAEHPLLESIGYLGQCVRLHVRSDCLIQPRPPGVTTHGCGFYEGPAMYFRHLF